jgi:hypothetical protein
MVEGNVKEEERMSTDLRERMFVDLTVEEEEDEESAEKEAEEEQSMRTELESESEESLSMDVSSDDESEVSNMKDNGMNDDYGLLINRGG